MGKVLVLGAGLVARPGVRYLLDKGMNVRVASRTLSKAEKLVEGHPNGEAVRWTVDEKERLSEMVKEADVVVSLLPYIYHVEVAKVCLEHRKHLVTTSYVSQDMRALDGEAKTRDVILLNEIGLDPGIDHMSAMRTIDHIRKRGGKILAFRSYCGALPAPEAADNPFKYKFAWSPRGVALAGRNSARFIEDGKEINIPGEELFRHYFTMEIEGLGTFEVYPNRDSVPYMDTYGIKEAHTIFRGTLRYPGWCDLWYAISRLGMLDVEEKEWKGKTYRDYMRELIGAKTDDIEKETAEFLGIPEDSDVMEKLRWLSIFSDDPIKIENGGNIDVLVEKLTEKLAYKEGERDMVILRDEVLGEVNGKKERHISVLIDYGEIGKDTAVARTVSLPAAVAVKLIIEGEIKERGVHIPTHPDIYAPVLEELKNLGIEMREEIKEE